MNLNVTTVISQEIVSSIFLFELHFDKDDAWHWPELKGDPTFDASGKIPYALKTRSVRNCCWPARLNVQGQLETETDKVTPKQEI